MAQGLGEVVLDSLRHAEALFAGVAQGLGLGAASSAGAGVDSSSHIPRAGGWPWPMFLGLTAAQFVLNWGVRVGAARPLAGCLFGPVPKTQTARLNDRVRRKRAARVDKFAQSAMEAFFYAWYFVMGGALAVGVPWFWPSAQWWEGEMASTGLGAAGPMPLDLTCFYVAYAARYLQGLVSVFFEAKRKDFWEMVIHHATTIVLIYLSFVAGMTRVGLVVMVLLDFADPFLHVAKCCKYVSEARRSAARRGEAGGGGGRGGGSGGDGSVSPGCELWGTLADVWFAAFALSFTVTRNIMYPYVVWSAWTEGPTAWRARSLAGCTPGMDYKEMRATVIRTGPGWCMLLLAVLQVLQLIWQYFLMKAIVRVLMGQELKDARSDSESEGGSGGEKKRRKEE